MTTRVQQQTATNAALNGMSCRLPGASNPVELWQLLLDPIRVHGSGLVNGSITAGLLRQVMAEALADAYRSNGGHLRQALAARGVDLSSLSELPDVLLPVARP